MVLVEQLPPESATSTAIRNSIPDDELEKRRKGGDSTKVPWSPLEGLVATLIDEVRYGNWLFAQSKSKNKLPLPQPIPRPGVRAIRSRRQMTIQEIKTLDPRLRNLSDDEALEKYREMTGRG